MITHIVYNNTTLCSFNIKPDVHPFYFPLDNPAEIRYYDSVILRLMLGICKGFDYWAGKPVVFLYLFPNG